jgi:hypothetical protein
MSTFAEPCPDKRAGAGRNGGYQWIVAEKKTATVEIHRFYTEEEARAFYAKQTGAT